MPLRGQINFEICALKNGLWSRLWWESYSDIIIHNFVEHQKQKLL